MRFARAWIEWEKLDRVKKKESIKKQETFLD